MGWKGDGFFYLPPHTPNLVVPTFERTILAIAVTLHENSVCLSVSALQTLCFYTTQRKHLT